MFVSFLTSAFSNMNLLSHTLHNLSLYSDLVVHVT